MFKEAKKIADFVGQDMSDFSIQEYHEVYMVDEKGMYPETVRFFKDKNIA